MPAGELVLSAAVLGPTIVDKVGQPAESGEGHFLFYVGVDFVPTQAGRPAYTTPGTYAVSAQPTYTWPGLTAGKYGVAVQFVNNDDTPFVPPLVDRVTVTVA